MCFILDLIVASSVYKYPWQLPRLLQRQQRPRFCVSLWSQVWFMLLLPPTHLWSLAQSVQHLSDSWKMSSMFNTVMPCCQLSNTICSENVTFGERLKSCHPVCVFDEAAKINLRFLQLKAREEEQRACWIVMSHLQHSSQTQFEMNNFTLKRQNESFYIRQLGKFVLFLKSLSLSSAIKSQMWIIRNRHQLVWGPIGFLELLFSKMNHLFDGLDKKSWHFADTSHLVKI